MFLWSVDADDTSECSWCIYRVGLFKKSAEMDLMNRTQYTCLRYENAEKIEQRAIIVSNIIRYITMMLSSKYHHPNTPSHNVNFS